MKQKEYIALLHPIGQINSFRIDFESEIEPKEIYQKLILEGYRIYQFIQEEFKYIMEENELAESGIEFHSLEREKKTWFGLSKNKVSDLLIFPKNGFFYPYQYGHYFYVFTKHKLEGKEFEKWLNDKFPKRFSDFDETYAGFNKDQVELMNRDDFLLITNHDYQKEFGLIGESEVIEKLLMKFRQMNLESYEEIQIN